MRISRGLIAALAALALAAPIAPATAAAQKEGGVVRCVNGRAGEFPCKGIDLLAHVASSGPTGGGGVADVQGWVDPESKDEFAITGGSGGVQFWNVTNPTKPVYLGKMLGKADPALMWQEMAIVGNHMYIVCDLSPCGLQVFDLTRLVGVESALPIWRPDVVIPLGFVHAIDANPETKHIFLNGPAFPVGTPVIFDVSQPLAPVPVGAMADDGYTHDSLCQNYHGPDKDRKGHEICFNFNEDTVTIYDVTTNTLQPEQLSRTTYKNASYTHSGALTKDHETLISTDEGDESAHQIPSTLYIWDVRDLSKPKMIGTFEANSMSIDHNVYSEEDALYHANYVNGFRILDLSQASKGKLREVAWFDTRPMEDSADFSGAWAAYPYLPSGNIIVGDMSGGIFIVRPHDSVYKSLGVKR